VTCFLKIFLKFYYNTYKLIPKHFMEALNCLYCLLFILSILFFSDILATMADSQPFDVLFGINIIFSIGDIYG